jgi:isoleucyl-tRNA synthetase
MTSTSYLDNYKLFEPTRAIKDFIDDMSTWYLRRSRDRIKDGDADAKHTLYIVLKNLVQIMAPFTPFVSEDLWQKLRNEKDAESVHLSEWPNVGEVDDELVKKMKSIRDFCTEGNALRKKLGIPVRQPLSSFAINTKGLEEFYDLVQEELNVKNILVGSEISLDTNITPELKKEGDYRELVRAVQDMRKAQGLMPSDMVTISLSLEAKDVVMEGFEKTVGAKAVKFTNNDGEEVKIDNISIRITIQK